MTCWRARFKGTINRRKENFQTGAESEASIFFSYISLPLLVHSDPSLALPFLTAITLFFPPLAYSYTLKMEAVYSSETSVSTDCIATYPRRQLPL
jgi:hypothetical protein